MQVGRFTFTEIMNMDVKEAAEWFDEATELYKELRKTE